MSAIAERADAQGSAAALRVLNGDLGLAQLWFDPRVLERYVGLAGWRVMRTNTVGRVRAPDGTSFDFGVAEGDGVLHATAADLTQRLPTSERQHWAQHLLALPTSRNFLTMRLAPGSCIDDGDLRDWTT